jgi:hypothetical protein
MGGGSGKIDCGLEFLMAKGSGTVALDKNGNPSPKQSCADGDPTCDFDAIPGQCTLRLAACINNVDARLPLCTSNSTIAIDLKKPSAKDAINPSKPGDDLTRASFLTILDDDGPIVLPDGRDNNCAPFEATVVMKVGGQGPKATSKTIKVQSSFSQTDLLSGKTKVKKDSDGLKLTCTP